MNDCPNGELRDLLPDLLHERLNGSDRHRVEAHVAECDDCRAELALLRDLRGTLRRVPAVDVGAIVAAIPPYRAPARRSRDGWRAAAAAVLIAVGGTSIAIARHSEIAPSEIASSAAPVVVSPSGPRDTAPTAGSRVAAVAPARSRELQAAGTVADLSDRELAALLDGLETLDVVPSTDVEPVVPAAAAVATQGES